jgi:hypothetical protein
MNYAEWLKLMNSNLSTDRSHTADEIPDDGDIIEITKLLLKALNDEDLLVRTCAADSLSAIPSESTRVGLRAALVSESNELVLSFIIHSVGSVGDASDLTRISQVNTFAKSASQLSTACSEAIIELGTTLSIQQFKFAALSTDFKIATGSLVALERSLGLFKEVLKSAQEIVKEVEGKNISAVGQEAIANIQKMAI